MKPGGANLKGYKFEREVCKDLSLWLSDGADRDYFWRSAMSGGRATIGRKNGVTLLRHAGDVMATHPKAHHFVERFVVDCKSLKKLNLNSLIQKGIGVMGEAWSKVRTEGEAYGKTPMLIVRENLGRTLMAVPRGTPGFAQAALVARLYREDMDIYLFDDLIEHPYERPPVATGPVAAVPVEDAPVEDASGVESAP